MSEQVKTTEPWSDLEAESAGFECEPGVSLTVQDDILGENQGSRWFSWSETVAFHKWLGQKIKDSNTTGWRPECDAPTGQWLITRRDGDDGTGCCHVRVWPDGEREWIDGDGRTTVTHHSFAAPTHWRFVDEEVDHAEIFGRD